MKKVVVHKQVEDYYFLHCEQSEDGYFAQIGVYSNVEQDDESFIGCAFGSGETADSAIEDARKNIHPDHAIDKINW